MQNRLRHGLERSEGGEWSMDRTPSSRVRLLFGLMCVAVAIIGVRFYYVQSSLGGEYLAEVERLTEKIESIPSRDARILSADGTVLAADAELYALRVHYRWLEDPVDPDWLKQTALARLSRVERRSQDRVREALDRVLERRRAFWRDLTEVTGLSESEWIAKRRDLQRRVEARREAVLRRRDSRLAVDEASPLDAELELPAEWWSPLARTWSVVRTTLTTPPRRDEADERLVLAEELDYHVLVSDLPREQALAIEARPERFPGARIELATHRVYPEGALAAHVIGYRSPLTGDELAQRRTRFQGRDPLDYREGDRVGRTGIERSYDGTLRGLRGERRVFLNRRGEVVRTEMVREPRSGTDVVLALDLSLQREAERLLDAAINGDLSNVSPSEPADPRSAPRPTGGSIVALELGTGRVLALASGPRFDLSRLGTEAGEAWREWLADSRKPLFHRAIEGTLPPGSVFKVVSAMAGMESGAIVPDEPFHCQGYLQSPNQLRCLIYKNHRVGHGEINLIDALARSCNVYFFDMARRAGPGPIVEWARKLGYGSPTGIDLPGEAAGNIPAFRGGARISGDLMGLAIGQASLTVTPLQVATMMGAVASDGQTPAPRVAEVLSPATESRSDLERSGSAFAWVRRGLESVVAHPRGTGYKSVRSPEVRIAGKTGTAETGGGRPDHAWFAGYAPAESPRVAFVVVLEHAGSGGHVAGPIAREFVESLLRAGLLPGSHAVRPAVPLAN